MTKKHSSKIELPPRDWTDSFQEHPLVQWIMEHRKMVLYALAILIFLLALSVKMTYTRSAKSETDYLLAENYLNLLRKGPPNQVGKEKWEGAFDKLQQIVAAYPELHSKYDGIIAQLFLVQQDEKSASPFALRTLERTRPDQLPQYAAFSKNTLLIEGAQYEKALSNAQALQEELLQKAYSNQGSEHRFGDLLFAFNLLRIAQLCKELGLKEKELKAWEEWKQFSAQNSVIDPEAFAALKALIEEGSFTIDQYITMRERLLH